MSKKLKKGSAKEKELKGMYEDMKDVVKKLKQGAATTKDMEDVKDKLKKMQNPEQK
jgi:hypothetical protein